MKDLVKFIAQALVDQPDQVQVNEIEGQQTSVIELRVAKEDLGKVIGKQGRADAATATTDPAVIAALGEVEIGGRRHRVLDAVRRKGQILLSLEGIHTRDQAEALVGQEVRSEERRV